MTQFSQISNKISQMNVEIAKINGSLSALKNTATKFS